MTTENIRVSASSVISSVLETSATLSRCRAAGREDIRASVPFVRYGPAVVTSSSRVRRRRGGVVAVAPACDASVEPALRVRPRLSVLLLRVPVGERAVPSTAGTVVLLVGIANASLRAMHRHLPRGE